MGDTASALKTVFIPALIALLLFLFLNYAIVPAWRLYRSRYGHYVPVEQLSSQTVSLGYRMHVAIGNFFSRASTATSNWRGRGQSGSSGNSTSGRGLGSRIRAMLGRRPSREYSEMDDDLLSDDGEELGTIRAPGADQPLGQPPAYDARRLSRELEQGFMDDSESESDDDQRQRR
ncbi:hypothetical protein F503_07822 [Ophiostoma piceae UAMH 11346]|uniref:Uncharacterized protein n=1 Tax=Ophiostoma piceae (strain UAMH 11346) TaxID=1262450 RepID=S3C5Q5_OPHP1|nr:hypothetical protein F503_07822 [Ophiostoma piceae UAMH 11346]